MPRTRADSGFTLLELMIVVIIIGILAAIAIPAFLNQRVAARNAATQSWVYDAVQNLTLYQLKNNSYAPSLAAAGINVPSTINAQYYASTDSYCVSAYNVDSDARGNIFGPVNDTWKVVYYPFSGRTSLTATNPDSYCVNSGG